MKVRACKPFISTAHGSVEVGQEIDVSEALVGEWLGAGMVERLDAKTYGTKVVREVPSVPGGEAQPSSSPAGRRRRKKTPRASEGTDES